MKALDTLAGLPKRGLYLAVFGAFMTACYPSEELDVPQKEVDIEFTELDAYIEENFTQEYGMAIRYRFVDNYLDPGQVTTPPRIELVRPMLDFVEEFWIGPYEDVPNGEQFFRDHVPAEIVFLGGLIFNANGTVTLGTADAGAQITFTNVNAFNPEDEEWRDIQLQTVYHEFAHTVHQLYKLPNAFETIASTGYTGPTSWFVLSDSEALIRGFVSPYSTSNPNEDFAEVIAFYMYDPEWEENFITLDPDCTTDECLRTNEGKILIEEKITTIIDHYDRVTGVSLESLREAVQSRL